MGHILAGRDAVVDLGAECSVGRGGRGSPKHGHVLELTVFVGGNGVGGVIIVPC